MKNSKSLLTMLSILIALVCLPVAAFGQDEKNKLATLAASGTSVRWDIAAANAGGTLTISSPDGRVFTRAFKDGGSPDFNITDKQGEGLPDGQYNYELRLTPVFSATQKAALKAARGKDDEAETVRAGRKRAAAQEVVESGAFTILNGAVIVAGAIEEGRSRPAGVSGVKTPAPARVSTTTPASFMTRYRRHHPLLTFRPDDVIPDDLIVQGSACVGLDCVNGEVFNFDTIRLKENNTRISFNDTSTAAGFPTRDWRLRANSSASGGASAFFIDDMGDASTGSETVSSTPLTLTSGAPTNSVFVASNGKVGFRTGTPVLDLHVTTSDTPAHRLEQTNAGGFTAQTWDIAGNEANFFVRDVTSGSRLPFRIRPGAPTSSIDIAASGNVGIGTASPQGTLHSKGQFVFFDDSTGAISGGLYANSLGANPFTMWSGAGDFRLGTGVTNRTVGTGFAERLRILNSNGRVGIGTSAPDQLLSVNGDASKVGGGSWQSFSDERLKKIKGNFNSGLKAVMQLQPLRYEYLRDNAVGIKSEGEHIGFGAQAVQKVIPEAVTANDNGYLMVNNDPIIWTMLNAIKEQQQQIEELKAQIRQLQAASRRK